MNQLGKEIRRLRQEKGWTQTELAVYAGSSQPTVNQIESGARNPSTRTLQKIAGALGADVADFFPKAQRSLPLEFEGRRAGTNDDIREWLRQLLLSRIPPEELPDDALAELRRLAAGERPRGWFVEKTPDEALRDEQEFSQQVSDAFNETVQEDLVRGISEKEARIT
jgi:transcriptional regulator with XRE-family HTH domain